MPLFSRVFLLLAAMLCGGFFAVMGGAFSYAVDGEHGTTSVLFWLVAGAVVSAPFWLPALVPNRFSHLLTASRRVGAVVLLLPTGLFGSTIVHNMIRGMSGTGITFSTLTVAAVITVTCLCAIVILTKRA